MELIVAALLWMGVVSSPDEVTDEVVCKYKNEIQIILEDEDTQAELKDLAGLLVEPPR